MSDTTRYTYNDIKNQAGVEIVKLILKYTPRVDGRGYSTTNDELGTMRIIHDAFEDIYKDKLEITQNGLDQLDEQATKRTRKGTDLYTQLYGTGE